MDQLLNGLDNGAIIIWELFGERGGEMVAELRSSHFYAEVCCGVSSLRWMHSLAKLYNLILRCRMILYAACISDMVE